MSRVSMQAVRATYKVRDSWWTVLLVDPVAGRLVRALAGVRSITPNRLTATAFLLGLGAAGAFLAGSPGWLVAGALLYYLSFLIDCLDGKIARLNGTGSVFGGWLDFLLDRLRVVICVTAVFAGQFARTERPVFLLAATGVVFLALFGYVNGAETDRARASLPGAPAATGEPTRPGPPGGLASRVQAALHRHRIRMNLVSGIEFEMAVLVVAPPLVALTGATALLWVTAVGAALLIMFEAALIGRFWLETRRADRIGAEAGEPVNATATDRIGAEAGEPADAAATARTAPADPAAVPTARRQPPAVRQ